FGDVIVTNCTISGNSVDGGRLSEGGGINVDRGSLILRNSIVAGNIASSGYGPDIKVNYFFPYTGTVVAYNNLIGNGVNWNFQPPHPDPFLPSPPGAPDSHGNWIGSTAHPLDPKLGAPADNGGPTKTM